MGRLFRHRYWRRPALLAAAALPLLALGPGALPVSAAPATVDGIACSQAEELGLFKQMNVHATLILVACGLEPASALAASSGIGFDPTVFPDNQWVSNRPDALPHSTKSESMVWSSDGTVIAVNYNDSRDAPSGYSGYSVSYDGGATFTQKIPSPFNSGHGANYGDPIIWYNALQGKWYAGDLAGGCGGQGIGLWTSLDAWNWTPGVCAASGANLDRESAWVDNNPASLYYGRMYISLNAFPSGALQVFYSDNGTTWTGPVTLSATFERDVQMTGAPDWGVAFVAAMIEGGGGFNMRQNVMYKTTTGGATWTRVVMGAPFAPPGDVLCGTNPYFVNVAPIWRYMGIGQPGVGPGGIVHYVYGGRGVNANDHGDIYYTRSDDFGSTWTAPIVLNTDSSFASSATQWQPSLAVTTAGVVTAFWYDRRWSGGTNNYMIWARKSADNGMTWGDDFPLQDFLITQPVQPDPNVQVCYAGDYNYSTTYGADTYATWTDGRAVVGGMNVQNVWFAKI
jgi:hypothetical protein